MNVYIPLGVFLALLCYLCRRSEKNARIAFIFSMSAVCVFAMIRYEFGPDYFNYRDIYEGIQGADINNYVGRGMSVEKTFLRFFNLFPSYTLFIIFLSVFWVGANAFFIGRYVPGQYYWYVLLYFFFKTDYFLDSLVAMRTTLCAAIFLVAIHFLIKKKRLIYIALILLASLFHTSALALVVFAFVNTNHRSFIFSNAIIIAIGVLAVISVLIGSNPVLDSFSSFVMDSVDELQRYSEREVAATGQSLYTLLFRLMSLAILVFLAKSAQKETNATMVLFYQIAVIAAMINLLLGQSLVNDRYFLILNPIYILCIVCSFKKNTNTTNVIISIILFTIAFYILYNKFSRPYFASFMEYKTIFSAPYIP